MDKILGNPLNQTISLWTYTETDAETNEGTYAKSEIKGFLFTSQKRVKDQDGENYPIKTCVLVKVADVPNEKDKILIGTTVETSVWNTDAQIIMSIDSMTNHRGAIEGYEVVLQ